MKMVIWVSCNDICATSLKNYESYVQNARLIQRFPLSEWTQSEVVEYYCKWFKSTPDDFIFR